jgi:hypothetical protein
METTPLLMDMRGEVIWGKFVKVKFSHLLMTMMKAMKLRF